MTTDGVRTLLPRLPERVEVIDCTLRDGEQAPGVWFTPSEKVALAKLLDASGVDLLDAGFPAACDEEVETMQEMRRARLRAGIAATARAVTADVAAAERARAQEVFLFLPISDLRLHTGLGIDRREARRRLRAAAEEVVSRGMGLNIVFEDACRADPRWVIQLASALDAVGPRRFVVCDTVGAAMPATIARLFETLRRAIDPRLILCTHCHNDFGLATANTLAAVGAGAAAVTCTVNGLGERAGNADLAEVVAALSHLYDVAHGIDPASLPRLAAEVERLSGVHTSPLKAVTGWNVYSHESGVHVDGMLKDARSYEFLPAAWSGRATRYVLGKHSGASLVRRLLDRAGIAWDEREVGALLAEVKRRSTERSKAEHARAWLQASMFRERALGGVAMEELLQLARSRRPPRRLRRGAAH